MGSAGSKSAPSSSSSGAGGGTGGARRARSRAHRVLQSSCLGTTSRSRHSHSDDQVCDGQSKDNGNNVSSRNLTGPESCHEKVECYRKAKVGQCDDISRIPSNAEVSGWDQANISNVASTIGSSSAQSTTPSNRFLSRFSLTPGNISFRLSRANSLGSLRSYPLSSTSLMLNNEDDVNLQRGPANGLIDRDERQQGNEQLPMSVISRRVPTPYCEDTSADMRMHTRSGYSVNSVDEQASSCNQEVARIGSGSRVGLDANLCSPRNLSENENVGVRVPDRHAGAREPIERNVRFSRTLSVGRLRDRVLRRTSLPDMSFCPVQQVGEVGDTNQGSGTGAWGDQTRSFTSEGSDVPPSNSSAYHASGISSSLFSIQDYEVEPTRTREARYQDLLEHRSNFLERRRRIRSQVRALQRLGSRFENLPGHERTCMLSGQHRTGRCTCRTSSRDAHLNDDTSARASISRIVMLAEALFEVLDEIHQQSVVLSSRPSVSSIGSVPAPSEVVESLPVKVYTKSQRHQNEEVAQCYICLVEYEEGDRMRVLPCQHEFHKSCVDKWLKEIHRVCPLCRGDICRSGLLPAEH